MKSHAEHTGMWGRQKPAHVTEDRGVWRDQARSTPFAVFFSSWVTIVAPELPTSLEETAHHGTWDN